ncbi:cucumisin [Ziziphus jujuba]|uniref:Cucumisin n=1 Tax=Ziziphus jujuba TaxID=326968 RepID=A0ABM4A4P8_ZIZJJ|nr:cucumisin [Ziziphus jujuba]
MAIPWLLFGLAYALLITAPQSSTSEDNREAYIVYMGDIPKEEVSTSSVHINMLQNVIGSNNIKPAGTLLHSYKRSFNGFAAKLTKEEAEKMAGMEGVVSMFPSQKMNLHTTKSWDFIGFPQNVKRSTMESNIIIGVFDTGIWPESKSFDDKGFGPPPTKWKGTCQVSANFTCSNKIIGAKYYKSDGFFDKGDLKSPRDSEGHGTHTASTAGGGLVNMASQLGFGLGTARGGVPSARIAVYKVCWYDGCDDADILAAFDDAISDGVDIITVSLGGDSAVDYFKDSIAIGSFHAAIKGILTSTSAGNEGPQLSTLLNFAPWSLSVAAATINRKFLTKVRLGNNKIYEGISINSFDLKNETFPLIYGGDAPNTTEGYSSSQSRYCFSNSLNKNLVKGKIVICDDFTNGSGPFLVGATGLVMKGRVVGDVVDSLPLPASFLSVDEGSKINTYMNSKRNATASIFRSNEVTDKLAPYIPSFSSRGPNPISRNILKPDLAAPGVYILAAWSPIAPISGVEGDDRIVNYNIFSGTSMACPHASATAAYIKSFHPTWSPAAIKSSLITTANPMRSNLNPESEFAYGSGLLNPIKAPFPGLIYDIEELDYVRFLCGEGYNTKLVQIITGNISIECPKGNNETIIIDLNHPSFALSTPASESFSRVFHRTVTNVGSPTSTYKANLIGPLGINITVEPSVLSFTSLGQKLSFALKIEGKLDGFLESASLLWDDGTFQVKSPIIIYVAL